LGSPTDPKYRKIRLNNPRIRAAVVETQGAVELLLACGFELEFAETAAMRDIETTMTTAAAAASVVQDGGEAGAEGEEPEGYAVLLESADLEPLRHAVAQLAAFASLPPMKQRQPAAASVPAPVSAEPAPSVQRATVVAGVDPDVPAPAAPRNTRVLLPTPAEGDPPAWFFERTSAEVKAAYLSAIRRKEESQQLLTRATRERRDAQRRAALGPPPTVATIRVRFPEGIALQGEFFPREPTVAVHAWVASALRDPLNTFELVGPDRTPVEAGGGSVARAGLVPSATLLFRWTGHSAVDMKGVPALRDEVLWQADAIE
jgi:UBX domain-containing protein 6